MKPSLENLSEDMKKTRQEQKELSEGMEKIRLQQDDLGKSVLSLQANEVPRLNEQVGNLKEDLRKSALTLSEEVSKLKQDLGKSALTLSEEVSKLKARLLYVATAATALFAVVASSGLSAYFRTIPAKIDQTIVEQVPPMAKAEVDKMMKEVHTQMEAVIYASNDFQRALNEYRNHKMGLSELEKMVKKRIQNEIIVSWYTDVLLNEEAYPSAFAILKMVKEHKLIPDGYKRSEIYTNVGIIQWIEALRHPTRREELVGEACGYLQKARDDAEAGYIKKGPLEWLIFVHLSQDDKKLARESARYYKQLGGDRTKLASHRDSKWFKDLVKKCDTCEDNLEDILAEFFPEDRPMAGPN